MPFFRKKKNGDGASVDKAKSFLEEATRCEEKRYESIGLGGITESRGRQ